MFLSEKISLKNQEINRLFFNMHHEFKKNNGYSNEEIENKDAMLKNSMFIDTIEVHRSRIKKSGFKYFEICFQFLNFCSLIAIK